MQEAVAAELREVRTTGELRELRTRLKEDPALVPADPAEEADAVRLSSE